MSSLSAQHFPKRSGSPRRSPYGRILTLPDGRRRKVRLYVIWESMRARCHYTKQKSYYRYGGRGIAVCAEWRDSYDAFRTWAISTGYRKDLTLDRVDNAGGYGPTNCRWLPANQQQWNTRATIQLTLNGITRPLPEWAVSMGVSPFLLRSRRGSGWTDEQVLTTPLGKSPPGRPQRKRGRKPRSTFLPSAGDSR